MTKKPSNKSVKNENVKKVDISDTLSPDTKKSRKRIDLEMKMKIIDLNKGGMSILQISKDLKLSRSTVFTILKDSEKIMEAVKSSSSLKKTVLSKMRTPAIEEMERILVEWIEEQVNQGITISRETIRTKARRLFVILKENSDNPNEPSSFIASNGWFDRFKRRHNLSNLEVSASSIDLQELKKMTCSDDERLQLFQNASEVDLANHTYVSDLLNIQSQDLLNNLLHSKHQFTTSGLETAFSTLSKAMNILSAMDPNQRRCENIRRLVDESVWCYKEIYNDLKKIDDKNLNNFTPQATPNESQDL